MKTKTILLAFLILAPIIAFSCKKDPILEKPKDITGEWKWITSLTVYPSDPITPENTGIHEILNFKSDYTWFKTENGIKVDSGTYKLGHGKYSPYVGARIFIYDSVVFFGAGSKKNVWDYYDVFNDTLQICPYFAGKRGSYNSYNLPSGFNGTKIWIK